jgi:hypothetical protein
VVAVSLRVIPIRWLERRLVVVNINKDDPEWVTLDEALGPLVEPSGQKS